MFKSRETKKLLNEWRSFINESSHKAIVSKNVGKDIARVKYEPSQEAKKLRDLLNNKFSKGSHKNFGGYEFFDQHSDEEMIGEDGGFQREHEALIEYTKVDPSFSNDLDISDFVFLDDSGWNDDIDDLVNRVKSKYKFSVKYLPYYDYEEYHYGTVNIDGQEIHVIMKAGFGPTVYSFLPAAGSNSSKQFDDEIDDQDEEVLGMFS